MMKIQCKSCRKKMEPIIRIEERIVSTDRQTFSCSLCGAELFATGGEFQKPFWERPKYAWYLGPLEECIQLWKWLKNFKIGSKRILLLVLILVLNWVFCHFFG